MNIELFSMVQRYKFESKSQLHGNNQKSALELFSMVQRYKFESKSQLPTWRYYYSRCCFQWSKDTNLKANHNNIYRYEKDIVLFSMVQRYKFESKSQHFCATASASPCCFQWSKDTNLKANHNSQSWLAGIIQVVFNGPKIQI